MPVLSLTHALIFFPSGAAAEQHLLNPEGCDQPAGPAARPARLPDHRPPLHPADWQVHYHRPETAQYQLLRFGPPSPPMVPVTPSTVASPMVMQHQTTDMPRWPPPTASPMPALRHQMPVTTAVLVPQPPPQQQQQAIVRTPITVVMAAVQALLHAAAQVK